MRHIGGIHDKAVVVNVDVLHRLDVQNGVAILVLPDHLRLLSVLVDLAQIIFKVDLVFEVNWAFLLAVLIVRKAGIVELSILLLVLPFPTNLYHFCIFSCVGALRNLSQRNVGIKSFGIAVDLLEFLIVDRGMLFFVVCAFISL